MLKVLLRAPSGGVLSEVSSLLRFIPTVFISPDEGRDAHEKVDVLRGACRVHVAEVNLRRAFVGMYSRTQSHNPLHTLSRLPACPAIGVDTLSLERDKESTPLSFSLMRTESRTQTW